MMSKIDGKEEVLRQAVRKSLCLNICQESVLVSHGTGGSGNLDFFTMPYHPSHGQIPT